MAVEQGHVTELRLVLTVVDYEAALTLYRDVLGLAQIDDYSTATSRVVVLSAGRATIELADVSHAAYVDDVEVGHRVAPPVRFAFEVEDVAARTAALVDHGATLIAAPTLTPWGSLNARLDAGEGFQLTLFGAADDPDADAG
jgi:predicted enzyme related to lactoylglutathione lyase